MNKKIADSELILNPDGSIYHLNLLPGDLATTIITVGDPDRVTKVSQLFDSIELKKSKREFITHTGYIGKKRISVISTGIGPDNIDIVLNECDAVFNIDLKERIIKDKLTELEFIRFGTSGCMQADIPVDDFLVSDYGLGLDGTISYYKRELTKDELDMQIALTDYCRNIELPINFEIARAHHPQFSIPSDIHRGITVTCCGFYGPQSRQLRAQTKVPNLLDELAGFIHDGHRITNLEMESSAIFGLSNILGHKSIAINTLIANRANGTFSKDPKKAVEKMIQTALGWITSI